VTEPRGLVEARQLEEQGYEAFKEGDATRSRDLNERSLELAREAGDPEAIARALSGLMRLGLRDRAFEEVERLAAECEDVARRAGNPGLRRMPLHMRAESARMQGELAAAAALYDESIALNEELGNAAMVAVERGNKAWVEIAVRHLEEAERLLRASLEATEDDYGIAFCLLGLARVELERGHERGAEILGAAEAVLERTGLVWDPAEQPEYEATLKAAGAVAGERLDELRAAGAEPDPTELAITGRS
jgi:tetratricopeptide (TPR) repeat protein